MRPTIDRAFFKPHCDASGAWEVPDGYVRCFISKYQDKYFLKLQGEKDDYNWNGLEQKDWEHLTYKTFLSIDATSKKFETEGVFEGTIRFSDTKLNEYHSYNVKITVSLSGCNGLGLNIICGEQPVLSSVVSMIRINTENPDPTDVNRLK